MYIIEVTYADNSVEYCSDYNNKMLYTRADKSFAWEFIKEDAEMVLDMVGAWLDENQITVALVESVSS